MRDLSDGQWDLVSQLFERFKGLSKDQQETLLQEMRVRGEADSDVLSILELKLTEPPDDEGNRTGDRIGNYVLHERLGKGGMGIVYKAYSETLQRFVAFKLLNVGTTTVDVARFKTEAQAAARLDHPHIVQVFEIGEQNGTHFIAFGLCAGGSLDKRLKPELPLPSPALAAQLTEKLAAAVGHAHEQGVVHRDLKPANVLLTGQPDAPLEDCDPKIADFGLAKRLDMDERLTKTGTVFGTPPYMSPEQTVGKEASIGPSTDVYSLGAMLYEMLTGRPPFLAANVIDILDQVRRQDPVPPRRLQRSIDRNLETICLTCLQKEPHRRYASALALVDDLRAFREGRSIKARRAGVAERLWRFCRRSPWKAGTMIALAVLFTTFVGIGVNSWISRSQRVAKVHEDVNRILNEASRMEGEKRFQDALNHLAGTNSILTQELQPRLHQQVNAAKGELRRKLTDQKVSQKFDEIRQSLMTANANAGFASKDAVDSYSREFRNYGIDLTRSSRQEAAKALRASAIRTQLTAALDDWAWLLKWNQEAGEPTWQELLAIAKASEPEAAKSNAIRDALLLENSGERLAAIAASAGWEKLAPQHIVIIGEVLVTEGRAHEAEKILRDAAWNHPSDFWVQYTFAYVLSNLGKEFLPESTAVFRAIVALRPDSAPAYSTLGSLYLRLNRLDDAEQALRRSVELFPGSPQSHLNLAIVLLHTDRADAAITESRESIRLAPQLAEPHLILGKALLSQLQIEEAIKEIRLAIIFRETLPGAHASLGEAYLEQRDLKQAEEAFRTSIQLEPDYPAAYAGMAVVVSQRGDIKSATEYLRLADEKKKQLFRVHETAPFSTIEQAGASSLSIHDSQDGSKQSKPAQNQAVPEKLAQQSAPEQPALTPASSRSFLGVLAELRDEIESHLTNKPNDLNIRLQLADVCVDLGDLQAAEQELRRVLSVSPKNVPSRRALAEVLSLQSKYSEAERELRQVIEANPKDEQALFFLAEACYQQGRFAEALDGFNKLKADAKDVSRRNRAGELLIDLAELRRLENSMPDLVKSEPDTAHEAEILGLLFGRKQDFGAATRFFEIAYPGNSDRLLGLYDAARCGVLAASGKGPTAQNSMEPQRARWRTDGLRWLKAVVEDTKAKLESAKEQEVQSGILAAGRLRTDPAFATVRDAESIQQLPENDATNWKELWEDVETARNNAILRGRKDEVNSSRAETQSTKLPAQQPQYRNPNYSLADLSELRQKVKANPRDTDLLRRLGVGLLFQSKITEGTDVLEKASEQGSAEASFNLGCSYAAMAEQLPPADPERARHFEASLKAFRKAIEQNPNYFEAHASLGWVNLLQDSGEGKAPEAVLLESERAFRRAIELNPKVVRLHLFLARVLMSRKNLLSQTETLERSNLLHEAEESLRRVVTVDENDVDAQLALGETLLLLNKFNDAQMTLEKAVSLLPVSRDAHFYLGRVLLGKNSPEPAQAAVSFQQAVQASEGDIPLEECHANLADAFILQDKLPEAFIAARNAINVTTQSTPTPRKLHAIAHSLSILRRLDEVVETCRKAIELQPDFIEFYITPGNCLLVANRPSEAEAMYRKALTLDKKNLESQQRLAQSLYEQGKFSEARDFQNSYVSEVTNPDEKKQALEYLESCDALIALQQRLPAALLKEFEPATAREARRLALLCYLNKYYAAAVRLYVWAESKEKLTLFGLQRAIRSSILAADGQGRDTSEANESERTKWRLLGHQWMQIEKDRLKPVLAQGDKNAKFVALDTLASWQYDPELATVRDETLVRKLTEDERSRWLALWKEIAGMVDLKGNTPMVTEAKEATKRE